MAGQSRTLKLSILADVDELKKSLNVGSQDVDGFAGKIGDFSKKAALAFAAVAAAAGAMAIKIGVDAVKAASDLGETISKVNVLFGDTAKDIEKFAEGAASSLGQTKQQALDAAATFATFGKSAGLSGQDLSKFSIDFVKLSSDLASFNNTSPEQAINAIGSALRGEAEPLRAYGVLLDDASLKQAALELGIISTTKNALTPQQKVLAAQALIYEQTGAAQGDFARTSDGLANQTRILTAQLENAKTTIGEALLPIVLQLATFIAENVLPLIQKFSEAFADEDSGLNGAIINVVDTLQNVAQPIWEGLVKAFNYIKDAIAGSKDEFSSFADVVKAIAPVLGTVLGGVITVIGKIASVVLSLIGKVAGAIAPILNTAIDGINLVIRGLNLIKIGEDIPTLKKIGETKPTAGFSGTTPGGESFAGTLSLPKIPTITTGTTGSTTTTPSTTPTPVASVAASAAAAAAAAANNIVNGSFNAGSFRKGEEASMGTTINLTVNGAFDKEGTARTIVDTLNDSFYRGTGGANNLQIA